MIKTELTEIQGIGPKIAEKLLGHFGSVKKLKEATFEEWTAIGGKATANKFHTILEIVDNGQGIDADKIEKIFIPFFSTRNGGSGIGLSLSKQIIYLHHGRLKVKSTHGKGSTFRIEI